MFSDAECPPVFETIELQTGESDTERQSSSSKQIKRLVTKCLLQLKCLLPYCRYYNASCY